MRRKSKRKVDLLAREYRLGGDSQAEALTKIARLAAEGHREAFDGLVAIVLEFRLIDRWLWSRIQEVDRNDIVQETLIQLQRSIPTFLGVSDRSFERWLEVIARRTASRYQDRLLASAVLDGELDDRADSGLRFSTVVVDAIRMVKAKGALDEDDQRVLDLFAEGVSQREAARCLGITESAYNNRLHRAKQKLKAEHDRAKQRLKNEELDSSE